MISGSRYLMLDTRYRIIGHWQLCPDGWVLDFGPEDSGWDLFFEYCPSTYSLKLIIRRLRNP